MADWVDRFMFLEIIWEDVREIIRDNSVKDIQFAEDKMAFEVINDFVEKEADRWAKTR